MNEDIIIPWLLHLSRLWEAFVLALVPALIARYQGRRVTSWYFYGVLCALMAWPLVALPTIQAVLLRPRGTHGQKRQRQRRADALALLAESSVKSYPSWIAELKRKSPAGIDCREYAYKYIGPGEALELVRESVRRHDAHAVAYYHRGVHLGYVPKRHRWIAQALDDGLRLAAIAEKVETGWIFRRRAKFVGTRIVVLYDGR
jgi:hypothetical protein